MMYDRQLSGLPCGDSRFVSVPDGSVRDNGRRSRRGAVRPEKDRDWETEVGWGGGGGRERESSWILISCQRRGVTTRRETERLNVFSQWAGCVMGLYSVNERRLQLHPT